MNLKKALQRLILIEFLTLVLGAVASVYLENRLPNELQVWITAYYGEVEISTGLFVILIIPVAIYFISMAGLFCLKPWAKLWYLTSTVVGVLLCLFLGPTVEHEIASTFWYISTLSSGAIIGLLLFTPVFEPSSNQSKNLANLQSV